MTGGQVSRAVRIPADVEREDRVLGNLTARQVALFAATAAVLYASFAATRTFVPVVLFAVLALPVVIAAAVLVLGSRDGLSLDRLALAAVRHRLAPRLQVAAPEGLPVAPGWVTANASHDDGHGGGPVPLRADGLRLPGGDITDAPGVDAGVIDLGANGDAVVCVASTVNFSLRTPGEQEALVAAFGRYLHSLSAPVQVLIAAHRLDLREQVGALRRAAPGLPHPALETAAVAHADFLEHLGEHANLLRRQVLLVLREPAVAGAAGRRQPWDRILPGQRDMPPARVGGAARDAAHSRLVRRVSEAAALLTPAGITISPLEAAQAGALLAAACNPDRLIDRRAPIAGPGDIITGGAVPKPRRDDGAGGAGRTEGDLDARGGRADDGLWWTR